MRKLFIPALAAATMMLGTALPGFADPNLPNVPRHRHFIQTPTGKLVEVGPRVCDNPSLQAAFNQFHHNVHQGAPGLHNRAGAEITARPCSFVP